MAIKVREVLYKPQEGPQTTLMTCNCEDILFGGARGGGKTFGVLLLFWQHERKYRQLANGLLLRRTYLELDDVIKKARGMWEENGVGVWEEGRKRMRFNDGGLLKFAYLERDSEASQYQGHEYTFICIEEAGNFPSPDPINRLRATLRSVDHVRKIFVLTANPGGPGHNWLKREYVDPAPPNIIHRVVVKGVGGAVYGWNRVFIPSKVSDNKLLVENNPEYLAQLAAATQYNDDLRKAWLEGKWEGLFGGVFDGIWSNEHHIVGKFVLPPSWRVYRSFDWGSSKPFSIGWWAVAFGGGEICYKMGEKFVNRYISDGTMIRLGEYYGCIPGQADKGLRLLEKDFIVNLKKEEDKFKRRWNVLHVEDGPADPSIFTDIDGDSVWSKHYKMGIFWYKVKKAPGSRKLYWGEFAQKLKNVRVKIMEAPGLLVSSECVDFIRTVPALQRSKVDPDDIMTNSEDHIADETSYMIRFLSTGFIKKVSVRYG